MERSDFAANEKRKHVVFCAKCQQGKGGCTCGGLTHDGFELLLPVIEIPDMVVFNPLGVTRSTFSLGETTVMAGGVPIGTVTRMENTNTDGIVVNETFELNMANVEVYPENFREALGYNTLTELLEDTGMEVAEPNEPL